MASLGILGGSFNPPHAGHLALALDARSELALERVVLMPLHTPPHKRAEADPGPEHRLAMCRLAVASEPGVGVCAREIERGGPSYTVDTLREIHAAEPEAELTFVVGADTALTLPSWREPESVLALARLAVADRPGSDGAEVLAVLDRVAPAVARAGVVLLHMEPVAASSTEVRDRIAAGADVAGLLPDDVIAYIREHGLYGTG